MQAYVYPSYTKYTGKGVTIGILMSGGYNPPDSLPDALADPLRSQ